MARELLAGTFEKSGFANILMPSRSIRCLNNKRRVLNEKIFLAFIHLFPHQFHFHWGEFRQFDSRRTF